MKLENIYDAKPLSPEDYDHPVEDIDHEEIIDERSNQENIALRLGAQNQNDLKEKYYPQISQLEPTDFESQEVRKELLGSNTESHSQVSKELPSLELLQATIDSAKKSLKWMRGRNAAFTTPSMIAREDRKLKEAEKAKEQLSVVQNQEQSSINPSDKKISRIDSVLPESPKLSTQNELLINAKEIDQDIEQELLKNMKGQYVAQVNPDQYKKMGLENLESTKDSLNQKLSYLETQESIGSIYSKENIRFFDRADLELIKEDILKDGTEKEKLMIEGLLFRDEKLGSFEIKAKEAFRKMMNSPKNTQERREKQKEWNDIRKALINFETESLNIIFNQVQEKTISDSLKKLPDQISKKAA